MTSKGQTLGSESSTDTPRPAPFRWWLHRLCVLACLIVAVIGVRLFNAEPPRLPEIPVIKLDDFDPEIAEAIQFARFAVEQKPRSITAWSQLAMVLHAHGFEDSAVVCYSATATLDARTFLWPYLQGIVLSKSPGGPVAALPCFERAVSLSPSDPLPRLWLAEMLLEVNRLDEAGKELGKVLAADPNNDRAKFGMGQLAVARRQYDEALPYLRAVAENPSSRRSSCALRAVAYERVGEHAIAESERRRLAELPQDGSWPDDAAQQISKRRVGLVARLNQVRQYGIQGRVPDAIALLQDTVQRYPKSDETWFSLGKVLFISNDPVGAKRALLKSIELAPNDAEYTFTLGFVELSQRNHEEAAKFFRMAVELKPLDGRAHFGLGECLQALGDLKGAADAYRVTLQCLPDHDLARQRLEKLAGEP